MRAALKLAQLMVGRTAPNPAVGCVIVKGGRIIAAAATAAGGRPHAEPRALAAAGARAAGATAYVTFEPCAHQGRTPPCAEALVAAGVRRVVVACLDPYPPVRGRGAARLRRAGIAVSVGVMAEECRRLNEAFIHRVTRRRPLVMLKLALTLDGKIAAPGLRWISSPASRRQVHRWRSQYDAVMVGAGTVIADDPMLTCRVAGGRDPARIIADARLAVSPKARIFDLRSKAPTIIATVSANADRARRRYRFPNVEVWEVAAAGTGDLDLADLMAQIAARGWSGVMLEGGARLAGAALAAGIVSRIAFFFAPIIAGAGTAAIEAPELLSDRIGLKDLSISRLGPDLLVQAELAPRRRGVLVRSGAR